MKLLSLLSLIFLASCGNTKNTLQNTPNMLHGTYIITQINNLENTLKDVVITFDTTSQKVSGYTGCNNFFGTYKQDGNTLTFSPLAATRKMCLENNINQTEHNFLTALGNVTQFKLNNEVLTLLQEDNTPIIKAQKKQLPHLVVIYNASTRGSSLNINVTDNVFTINKNSLKDGKTSTTKKLAQGTYNNLINLVNKVNLNNLNALSPSSNNRATDAALTAKLTITQQEKTYNTKNFDHGNPPKEILNLVNFLLSLNNEE